MKRLATLALALALATLPLTACGGASGSDAGTDSADSPAASEAAPIDTSSWTTLGEALAIADDESDGISYSYNEDYFVCVFESNGSRVRTVSEMDPSIEGKFDDLDYDAKDYTKQFAGIVGNLKLKSAEDITADVMSQDELDALVGKTGQELVDDGFVFESYNFYGGEQTGADMGRGYYSYDITFDTQISEDQTEDEGASIMGAKVTAIEGFGNLSSAALDPEQVD